MGVNTTFTGQLAAFSAEEIAAVVQINVMPVTLLSRYFLKKMKTSNIKGIIINLSSVLELTPMPYGAVYAASKAYVCSFTKALQCEAKPYGIRVQLVSAGFVQTQLLEYSSIMAKGGIFAPSAEEYVRCAVSTIGISDETSAYHLHACIVSC